MFHTYHTFFATRHLTYTPVLDVRQYSVECYCVTIITWLIVLRTQPAADEVGVGVKPDGGNSSLIAHTHTGTHKETGTYTEGAVKVSRLSQLAVRDNRIKRQGNETRKAYTYSKAYTYGM